MRDPRIAYTEKDRHRLTVEECRLTFTRETFLAAVRAGSPIDFRTWAQAEWAADRAFPK